MSGGELGRGKIEKGIGCGDVIMIGDKWEMEKYWEGEMEKLEKRLNGEFKKGMSLEKV